MKLPEPFAYPSRPHVRRHGPQGYPKYGMYRNWLRDEFSFRCIYCLRRETWLTLRKDYEIDHFLPKSDHPDVERDYDNLVFACRECNGTKATKHLPSPEEMAYGECLSVDRKGEIKPKNKSKAGQAIIEALDLNGREYVAMRRKILDLLAEYKPGSKTFKHFFGYPEDLPDLSKERNPKTNKRPEGIRISHYERDLRGELPTSY